ncbi:MAG TPA: S8 family serine peptidase, partial [Solirubrobacteraceae bacterium]
GAARTATDRPSGDVSPFTSRGPAFDGTPKPDLAAPGAATAAGLDDRPVIVGGTAVAAARVAAEAARLAAAGAPGAAATPAQLRAALTAAAAADRPDGAPLAPAAAGAGALRRPPAGTRALATDPESLLIRPQRFGGFGRPFVARTTLRLRGAPRRELRRLRFRSVAADGAGPGGRITVSKRLRLTIRGPAQAPGSFSGGRLEARDAADRQVLSVLYTVVPKDALDVPVGPLELTRRGGAVSGVRFALGAFERGSPFAAGTRLRPAERLELELLRPGGELVRRLTPPGGARELLPAEYAYTLDRRTLRGLHRGSYVFRVRARAPRQARPTVRRSEVFRR